MCVWVCMYVCELICPYYVKVYIYETLCDLFTLRGQKLGHKLIQALCNPGTVHWFSPTSSYSASTYQLLPLFICISPIERHQITILLLFINYNKSFIYIILFILSLCDNIHCMPMTVWWQYDCMTIWLYDNIYSV